MRKIGIVLVAIWTGVACGSRGNGGSTQGGSLPDGGSTSSDTAKACTANGDCASMRCIPSDSTPSASKSCAGKCPGVVDSSQGICAAFNGTCLPGWDHFDAPAGGTFCLCNHDGQTDDPCNGADDNCNGIVDEGGDTDCDTRRPDAGTKCISGVCKVP